METSICLRWEVPAHRSPLLHGEDQEFRIEANRFPVSNNQTQIPSDGKKKKKNTLTILQIKVENKINRHWQTEQWFTPAAQHSNIQIQFPDHLPQSDKHTKLQIAILANNDHSTSEQRVAPPVFKGYYTGYVLESHAVHLFISLIRFNTDGIQKLQKGDLSITVTFYSPGLQKFWNGKLRWTLVNVQQMLHSYSLVQLMIINTNKRDCDVEITSSQEQR